MLLNPEQQRAVDYGGGPLMVLAGAGSGKTRVLVHRIASLIERGVPAPQIWAVTFTNKAAGEMRARLRYLGPRAYGLTVGTFHASCARFLRQPGIGERVGLSGDFAIFDDDDQQKLIKALLKERKLEDAVTPRSVSSFIDRAKNRDENPAEVVTGLYLDEIVRDIYPAYQEALLRENAADFNDLLLHVLHLTEDSEVGPLLCERFEHVLVDEFQDTNVVQYRLVGAMAKTGNLTVVGDDDQSIYSWRGAEPRNLLNFDRDFPDTEIVKLEQNYRSTDVILQAANGVIAENTERHPKALWTDREGGDLIQLESCADERTEASFIAGSIAALTTEEGRDWGDFAVLYRTHAQSRVLEERLRAQGIDYIIVGGVSFFMRKEIKDLRSYLRLVSNDAADSAFSRIVNVPARGIGKTTIERLRGHARKASVSLLEAARVGAAGGVGRLRADARRKLAAFIDIIDGLRNVASSGASVAEMIIQTVERSGYRERLEAEDTSESRDRLNNMSELVSMASDFDDETDGEGKMVEFEERISLASANDSEDGKGRTVTLMTVHAAKGLEFPVVFVCGLEDGLFPSLRDREETDDRRALEEERRLAYVAFTRAEDRLILSNARIRRHWGEVRMTQPSRFIRDIPPQLLAMREAEPPPRRTPSVRWRERRDWDELDQRTGYEDVPEYIDEVESASVGIGTTVSHGSFGRGRVLETRGSGRDQKLLINFESVGLKTILARFVELR